MSAAEVCPIPELEIGHIKIIVQSLRQRIERLEGREASQRRAIFFMDRERTNGTPHYSAKRAAALDTELAETEYKLRLLREALQFLEAT